jgi:hypothetical protein
LRAIRKVCVTPPAQRAPELTGIAGGEKLQPFVPALRSHRSSRRVVLEPVGSEQDAANELSNQIHASDTMPVSRCLNNTCICNHSNMRRRSTLMQSEPQPEPSPDKGKRQFLTESGLVDVDWNDTTSEMLPPTLGNDWTPCLERLNTLLQATSNGALACLCTLSNYSSRALRLQTDKLNAFLQLRASIAARISVHADLSIHTSSPIVSGITRARG